MDKEAGHIGSVNSSAVIIDPNKYDRSLSSYFSKCTRFIINNLFLVIIGLLIWSNSVAFSSTDITTTTNNSTVNKNLSTLTMWGTVKDYWTSKSYVSSITMGITAMIYPYIFILSLIYIWIRPLSHNKRNKILFINMIFGKLSLLIAYITTFLTLSTYIEIQNEQFNLDIKVTSSPISMFGVYIFSCMALLIINNIFYIYSNYYTPTNQVDDDKFIKKYFDVTCNKMFAFIITPKSIITTIIYSIFLALVVFNSLLVLQVVFTAIIRFDLKGLISMVLPQSDTIRAYSMYKIPAILIDDTTKGAVSTSLAWAFFISTSFAAIFLQFLCLWLWFIPGNVYKYIPILRRYDMNTYFGILVKFLFMQQSLNCFDLYFIAIILNKIEIRSMTRWLVNESELPQVCGDGKLVPEMFGECFYVDGNLNVNAFILTFCVWIIQWFILFYSYHVLIKIRRMKH